MKANKAAIIPLIVMMFISGFGFLSCKEPVRPKAVVTVMDSEGKETIEGAEVIVHVNNDAKDRMQKVYLSTGEVIADTTVTSAAGQVAYEFKYEAIYNVIARTVKIVNKEKVVLKQGTGVLILKEDETCNETIKIR